MPSAAGDVARVAALLRTRAPLHDGDLLCLTSEAQTTRDSLRRGLDWLVRDAGPGDQLVFYFSGHGGSVGLRTKVDVLFPSDTRWSRRYIDQADLSALAKRASRRGAHLEIVLEACSAGGFAGLSAPAVPGCVVWSAASMGQHSHSGPVPQPEGDEVGLFTHFFCEHLPVVGSRRELHDAIVQSLDAYRLGHNRTCSECLLGPQTPVLACAQAAELARPP